MELSEKSRKRKVPDIADYYAVRIGPIWAGLKQESPAFWWLCIYVFLEYFRPQSIYPAIDVLPWLQITLILAFVTAFSDETAKVVSNPGNRFFITYIIIILISCLFAFMPLVSLGKINIIVNWVILYFLIVSIINTERRFIIFLLLFLLVNFKMSQHGFISYASRGFSYARWGLTGSPGWFQNAGDFGIQMAIFCSLSAAFVLALRENWGRLKRLLFYLLPFTAMVSVIGSASRGAQMGLATAGVWFLLKNRAGIKAMVGILLVGWIAYSALPEEMLEEFHTAGTDKTSLERFAIWELGMDVFLDNPVIGVGYENWIDYCWSRFHEAGGLQGIHWCLTTHNSYLLAGIETGILGLTAYVLMLLSMFYLNANTRKVAGQNANKFLVYIAHGLDGGLIVYIVSTFFFTVTYYPIIYVQLAMTVAINLIAKRQSPMPD